jgi:hypothetical protein
MKPWANFAGTCNGKMLHGEDKLSEEHEGVKAAMSSHTQ